MKINRKALIQAVYLIMVILLPIAVQSSELKSKNNIFISCKADNDLYKTLKENKVACIRYNTPTEVIDNAVEGAGVLILADDYPTKTTLLNPALFDKARIKKLRLYVEYPSYLPGINIGESQHTQLERIVVSSPEIKNLIPLQILILHSCNYVTVPTDNPLLVAGKVAGFDRAIYGLDSAANPHAILFKASPDNLLVSTTKLSQFVTARYAPKKGIQALWTYILQWVEGGNAPERLLDWSPTVHPSYTRDQALPSNAAVLAIKRATDWHTGARTLLNEQGWEEYKKRWKLNDSNVLTTGPTLTKTHPLPTAKVGDGSYGILEGIQSQVNPDGSQPTRSSLRSDCNGESSLAFALRSKLDGDKPSKLIAKNLLDWVYFRSGLFQNDSGKANYGLIYWLPGNAQALYQDNDVKVILGCIGTAGILDTDRWNEVLIKNILGNFRTTGMYGFRGWRLENPDLLKEGWQSYWDKNTIQLQPHYEAWTWASYLWLYNKTHWEPLLKKTSNAIRKMMEGYPSNWKWTNGIQQERGRMLLPLAWLIRVDDKPEYRAWLKLIANDIEKYQDKSGAIREELGALDHGDMAPPVSNAAYGEGEAPLIHENGDPVSDLLYTCNFTFLGLHEAYAATSDLQYKRMADKLADFLIRIQVRSEKHKELDGGWFRAFDYRRWDYLGSDADAGWGAWSIETGWTQAWVPTVLTMRELNKNLWDISQKSKVGNQFEQIRQQMIPNEFLQNRK